MDAPEILFYVVAALIYFLTKKKKKPKAPPTSDQPRREQEDVGEEGAPPVSFEDLLRELTGKGSAKPKSPPPTPAPAPEIERPRRREMNEEMDVITSTLDDDAADKKYADSLLTAAERKARPRQMGEEMELLTSSLDDDAIKKKYEESIVRSSGDPSEAKPYKSRFAAYQIEEKDTMAGDIKDMLTNPTDIKKAVILNEVLATKF